jgi:hypothetical protein
MTGRQERNTGQAGMTGRQERKIGQAGMTGRRERRIGQAGMIGRQAGCRDLQHRNMAVFAGWSLLTEFIIRTVYNVQ